MNKILTEIALNKGVTVLEQMTEVKGQLLDWHFTISGITFFLSLFVIIVLAQKSGKIFKNCTLMGFTRLTLIWGVVLGFSYRFMNLDWLQIWVSPKVWLLEYVAEIIK